MASITLKECPKVYMLETHRAKPPAATLQFLESTRGRLGMLAFQDVTARDRIGLPVFTCDRIRPDDSKTSHTGKGVSKTQAQVSLVMEAIERYCSEFREEYHDRLIYGSYRDLRDEFSVQDPEELILPAFADYQAKQARHWIWGVDLAANSDLLVPAEAVYHPFELDPHPLFRTHTNGLATGNTLEEAVFHGMTEVIERDAWSIAKYHNAMNAALTVDERPEHQFLRDIIQKFEDAAVAVTVRDLTTDLGVPVIAAFSQDARQPDLMPFDGFGAHLDPRVAMARALLELAATRAFLLHKYGLAGLRTTSAQYWEEPDGEDPRFQAHEWKALGKVPSRYRNDIRQDIATLLEMLEACGLKRTVVVALTRQDLGIPTVRVIIPGMEVYCFDRERKGDRLFRS